MDCSKIPKGGGPVQIGAILVTSKTICAGCNEFGKCTKTPATLALVAMAQAGEAAINPKSYRNIQHQFEFMN